ncbi:hypothetical protein HDU98_011065 [Podochytrium sp. JEL0797]|nr:hypothetical protein HDU98_011065 [Podochytrium sp. JEL0797]
MAPRNILTLLKAADPVYVASWIKENHELASAYGHHEKYFPKDGSAPNLEDRPVPTLQALNAKHKEEREEKMNKIGELEARMVYAKANTLYPEDIFHTADIGSVEVQRDPAGDALKVTVIDTTFRLELQITHCRTELAMQKADHDEQKATLRDIISGAEKFNRTQIEVRKADDRAANELRKGMDPKMQHRYRGQTFYAMIKDITENAKKTNRSAIVQDYNLKRSQFVQANFVEDYELFMRKGQELSDTFQIAYSDPLDHGCIAADKELSIAYKTQFLNFIGPMLADNTASVHWVHMRDMIYQDATDLLNWDSLVDLLNTATQAYETAKRTQQQSRGYEQQREPRGNGGKKHGRESSMSKVEERDDSLTDKSKKTKKGQGNQESQRVVVTTVKRDCVWHGYPCRQDPRTGCYWANRCQHSKPGEYREDHQKICPMGKTCPTVFTSEQKQKLGPKWEKRQSMKSASADKDTKGKGKATQGDSRELERKEQELQKQLKAVQQQKAKLHACREEREVTHPKSDTDSDTEMVKGKQVKSYDRSVAERLQRVENSKKNSSSNGSGSGNDERLQKEADVEMTEALENIDGCGSVSEWYDMKMAKLKSTESKTTADTGAQTVENRSVIGIGGRKEKVDAVAKVLHKINGSMLDSKGGMVYTNATSMYYGEAPEFLMTRIASRETGGEYTIVEPEQVETPRQLKEILDPKHAKFMSQISGETLTEDSIVEELSEDLRNLQTCRLIEKEDTDHVEETQSDHPTSQLKQAANGGGVDSTQVHDTKKNDKLILRKGLGEKPKYHRWGDEVYQEKNSMELHTCPTSF